MSEVRRAPVLAGAVANLAAGTLFGWSLVARPAGEAVGMSPAGGAAVFASAIVVLAVVLLVLGPVQRRVGPRRLLRVAALLGGGGLLLAATARHPLALWLGVALLFGVANGLAYGVSVVLATRVPAPRRGRATGLVVGAYAVGPVVLGLVAPAVLVDVGWRPGLLALALVVAALLAGAAQLAPDRVAPSGPSGRREEVPYRTVALLWVVFAGGTAPALLLFAHAVTVAGDRGLGPRAAGLAVSALAAGNLLGRLTAGAWSDRIGRLPALAGSVGAAALSVGALAVAGPGGVVLVGFLGTGLAYGAVSALVPAATADRVGPAAFPVAYGVVFTGWGCAGLVAPVVGGQLIGPAAQDPALLLLAGTPLLAAAAALAPLLRRPAPVPHT